MSDSEPAAGQVKVPPVQSIPDNQHILSSVAVHEPQASNEFALERYRFILQQIHAVNENIHRFLAIYQALATTMVGAALALYVGYRKWGIAVADARTGVVGLLIMTTVVAAFTMTLIVVGVFAWADYRNEESDLTDELVRPGFRTRPRMRNLARWYESYMLAFIAVSVIVMWLLALLFMLPTMH